MLKPTSAKSIPDYLRQIDEPRRSEMKKLHEFIKKTVPALKPEIHSGMSIVMIGYGVRTYKTKSGLEGTWPVIGLSSQKQYISVYCCVSDGKQYIAEKYVDQLPKASIGKSCIRFKKVDDIDLKILEKILKESLKYADAT